MGSNRLFKPAKQDLGTRVPTMSERQPRGSRPLGIHAPRRLRRFDKSGFGHSRGEPGGAGVSRTRDLAIRNRSLYPTELQPRRLSSSPSLSPYKTRAGARKPTHTRPLSYDNRTRQNRQSHRGTAARSDRSHGPRMQLSASKSVQAHSAIHDRTCTALSRSNHIL